ncbi:Crp/Fnr family transcriptional regulator [Hydrogenophaga sp. RWCD_12]|uniref:Crp/Fnr family transcriptional regulator n=1 Tax=Hydrogenophaga sp. RWCD_12 TaxID=3391190 RepID=UPI003984E6AD
MNAALPAASARFDVMDLAQAMRASSAIDAVPLNLSDAQWGVLGDYLQPVSLGQGQTLIEQGVKDRTVYFVESGSLTVHYEDHKERMRIAIVNAGSLLGEGAFFSHLPRSASVMAGSHSRLWCMTPLRFRELSQRHPAVALDLCVAMSAVMARRMYHRPKRMAVT